MKEEEEEVEDDEEEEEEEGLEEEEEEEDEDEEYDKRNIMAWCVVKKQKSKEKIKIKNIQRTYLE